MKKIYFILGILAIATGCARSSSDLPQFTDVIKEIHDFTNTDDVNIYNSATNYEYTHKGNVTFKVNSNYPNVLYVTFSDYAKMANNRIINPDYKLEVSKNAMAVKKTDGTTVFAAQVNPSTKSFYVSGSPSAATTPSEDYMSQKYGALLADMEITTSVVKKGSGALELPFTTFMNDLPVYTLNGELLAPLALYDVIFGSSFNLFHLDLFDYIMQYNSVMTFAVKTGASQKMAIERMQEYYNVKGYPKDLRLLERASLYQLMDSYYGLATNRHITSMSEYFHTNKYDDVFLLDDAEQRCYGVFDTLASLNDDHTGITSISPGWGDKASCNHRGRLSVERKILKNSLTVQRNEALKSEPTEFGVDDKVYYSSSGKVAYFYFDSFMFDLKEYNKDNPDPDIWKRDSYFYFLHQFQEIEKHGGVEKVLIDDSLNGGGTVGIAIKLINLISKTNYAEVINEDVKTGEISKMASKLDTNHDGKYDENDIFGNKFKSIGILTSPNSFSCGNLLPVAAKRNGIAKIFGQTSGGGECTVGSAYLPSARGVSYSSLSRLVMPNSDGTFDACVEAGATPDYEIPYNKFYDLDFIESVWEE
ncbi:MAG: S41 family peptidase [Bacilli bacterium]|nr:S41 family peptidase [Bacilli bacterium]